MRILDNIGLVQDPIHLGAVILDKLIGDLKSKLPFLNKKKSRDDDEDDDDEGLETATETEVASDVEEKTDVSKKPLRSAARKKDSDDEDEDEEEAASADNTIVGKIKSKLSSLKKAKASDDEEEDTDAEIDADIKSSRKEKKKPNYIVIGGAALLIGFILFSDFGDETPPAQDPSVVLKPKGKKVTPPDQKPTEEAPVEAKPTETATTETPVEATPTEATPTETTATETKPAETTPTETTTTTPVEATTTETTPVETAPTETATTETPVEATPTETIPVETAPTETIPTETTPSETATTDSVNGEQAPTSDDNLTEKILQDLEDQAKVNQPAKTSKEEYVTPPNYENVGRGLVYNCIGKHWACIDAPSYKTCEDNSSGNKFLKKKTECYPFNVYETQSGCEKMQNRVVSSSAKTEFCSE